ncbi:hypothetical protein [Pedobacter sp. N23S346]|uniref:hypothetical protein n=1 Tax=Pedobacter sp. N23S346 TaxID=3402750 RepID=UPI003ACF1984
MKNLKYLFIGILLLLSLSGSAQQWAVSASLDGYYIYDRNNNLIASQNSSLCKYVATGSTRTGNVFVCDVRWWFGGCLIGHYETFTEREYRTNCPLDDFIWILILPISVSGFYSTRFGKKSP